MNRYFAALAQRSGAYVPAPRSMRTHALDAASTPADHNNAMGGAALEVEQVVYAGPATTHRVVEPTAADAPVAPATVSATIDATRVTSAGAPAQQSPAAASPVAAAAMLDARTNAPRKHPSPASRTAKVEQRAETIAAGPERSTLAQAVAARTMSLLHADAPLAQRIDAPASRSMPAPAAVDVPPRAVIAEQRAAVRTVTRHDAARGDHPRAPSPPAPSTPPATARAMASPSFDVALEMTPGVRMSESMRAPTRASVSPATAAPVEIHIGAINVEIRQPQAPSPAPVAAPLRATPHAQPEPRRLSRFYLRGW